MMRMLHATLLSLIATSIAFANARVWTGNIISNSAWKCLDVRDSNFQDGTAVQIYDCNESSAQKWQIYDYNGLATTEVRLAGTKFCLDAINVDTSNKVVIRECTDGNPQQQWTFSHRGPIALALTDLCLDVPYSSTEDSEQVQTYQCTGNPNQVWSKYE
ncbi:ricin B-like lectin [Phlegmacium glaucopus]|nr:ricin B-like lectin [Phlegmacium glaucopus]